MPGGGLGLAGVVVSHHADYFVTLLDGFGDLLRDGGSHVSLCGVVGFANRQVIAGGAFMANWLASPRSFAPPATSSPP